MNFPYIIDVKAICDEIADMFSEYRSEVSEKDDAKILSFFRKTDEKPFVRFLLRADEQKTVSITGEYKRFSYSSVDTTAKGSHMFCSDMEQLLEFAEEFIDEAEKNSARTFDESYLVEMYPRKGERKDHFVDRFMSDDKILKEFPDVKQRYAVCMSYWERKDKR